jgi:hypothetical protein
VKGAETTDELEKDAQRAAHFFHPSLRACKKARDLGSVRANAPTLDRDDLIIL